MTGREMFEGEMGRENPYTCFECETQLIGPLCPACNPRTGYSRFEIRVSAFTGMIVGMVIGVILTHLI